MTEAEEVEDVARLRELPLFSEIDEEHMPLVAGCANPFEVEAGFVLIEHGQPGSGMFVLLDGTVEVDLPNREPLTLGPGEFFGELSLLTDTYRVARVRATTPVRGLAISRTEFWRMLHDEPGVALGMLPVLARRLVALETGSPI
jgi:CRP-like cAMP-binding protein